MWDRYLTKEQKVKVNDFSEELKKGIPSTERHQELVEIFEPLQIGYFLEWLDTLDRLYDNLDAAYCRRLLINRGGEAVESCIVRLPHSFTEQEIVYYHNHYKR